MMDDNSINKYLELISKVEYDNNDNEKLFVSVTNKLEDNNNVQIEKVNSIYATSRVSADKYTKRFSFILCLSAVLVLFSFLFISILPDTRSKIESIYNRLLVANYTSTPHTTPSLRTHYTSTPILTPKKTPLKTEQQTPNPTVLNEYMNLDTENTRDFTKEEEIIDNIYHIIFPDRNDYIAYWMDDAIFWAPAHLEGKISYGDYVDLYKINYKYELLPNENSKILFFEEQVVNQLHYRNLYCVKIKGDTGEVLSKRYDTYHIADSLSYKVINCSGKTYIAFTRNKWEHGELYSSEIISCDTMEQVWSIQDLYPDNWELHKEVLTEGGIEVYYGERLLNHLVNVELVKTIPYDELI